MPKIIYAFLMFIISSSFLYSGTLIECPEGCIVENAENNISISDKPAFTGAKGTIYGNISGNVVLDSQSIILAISIPMFFVVILIVFIKRKNNLINFSFLKRKHNNFIFISYRRCDSEYVTSVVHKGLMKHFPRTNIFIDIESIPPGGDFRKVISNNIDKSNILLVIIGDKWVSEINKRNNLASMDSPDYVRVEISRAFENKIPVIPILLNNVRLPNESELPSDIKDIAFSHALPLRPEPDFENDLIKIKEDILKHQLIA